jgi:hypothetical protein
LNWRAEAIADGHRPKRQVTGILWKKASFMPELTDDAQAPESRRLAPIITIRAAAKGV